MAAKIGLKHMSYSSQAFKLAGTSAIGSRRQIASLATRWEERTQLERWYADRRPIDSGLNHAGRSGNQSTPLMYLPCLL